MTLSSFQHTTENCPECKQSLPGTSKYYHLYEGANPLRNLEHEKRMYIHHPRLHAIEEKFWESRLMENPKNFAAIIYSSAAAVFLYLWVTGII